ncbi:MAG TPA: DNA polymerase IV [Clostridiales bacterium]|nr:DNA polymerase IV [Clostridiales bacterium]
MDRLIFHIDVNSAYLSWEAARRTAQGEVDLRTIPAAIGGDRESRTGVILAKSIPAKQYGVETGEPIARALKKCPDLVLARPDFRLYETNSRAFMDICRSYAPVVEKFSIDECFLDMSGTSHTYPDPVATAYEIKDTIRDTLGFTVNVGIGTNKLLAKMASDFEKPDKVHTLFPEEIPDKLWPLPVGALFSIGRSTAAKLERAGIHTIGELANSRAEAVQALIGVKAGLHIHNYANGIDHSAVLMQKDEAKGFSISTTLAEDVTTQAEAHRILLALADSVAARMRADSRRAYCIGVVIRANDFKNHSHQKKLEEATDITAEIFAVSRALFDDLWDMRTPLRLLGISLTELTREETEQLTLFPDEHKKKARRADKAIDAIRSKYGLDSIQRGFSGGSRLNVGRKYRAQMEDRQTPPQPPKK